MIKYSIKGLKQLLVKTEAINRRTERMNVPLAVAAGKAYKNVIDHFQKEQGETRKWVPLSERTVRRRRGGSSAPLQDTGRLKGSIRFKAFSNRAEVFTNIIYAAVHNYGYKKLNIPKRDFMWIDRKTRKNIVGYLEKYIVRGK